MKKYVVVIVLIVVTNLLFGQTVGQKGTWVFGLNPFHFNMFKTVTNTRYYADTLYSKDTSKANGYGFSLRFGAGYFVNNNLCMGVGFTNFASYEIAPIVPTELFIRYYLFRHHRGFSYYKSDITRRSVVFVQGTVGGSYRENNIENGNSKSETTIYGYGAIVSAGYTYLIRKRIALETIVMYQNYTIVSKDKNTKQPSQTSKSIRNENSLNFSLGVQAYF